MNMGSIYDGDEEFEWDEDGAMEDYNSSGPNWNNRYGNAYGNYSGGYGPPGGFGPPGGGPPLGFGPIGFPPRGPGPAFMWGRGFGPHGPPIGGRHRGDDRAIRYLLRCGVTKENLRNLPRDLLHLIDPQGCGLCGQNFDSFSTSRVHYTSKNHMKNQRKWLAQRSEGGYQRPKEIPLKSRELYCELCDVHITSKVHAESHYAGRPHRAIVEGRKLPKNPFLLQKNMRDRIDQLIRREKKNLKPVEDKPEETPTEAQSSDPDLYCEICKTSVTCSDQMTMHLNGKKHLGKEKRHILDMMKGGANDNGNGDANDNGNGDADADGDADGDDDAENDENPAEEKDEWTEDAVE